MKSLSWMRYINANIASPEPERLGMVILTRKVKMLQEMLDWSDEDVEAWRDELRQIAKESA